MDILYIICGKIVAVLEILTLPSLNKAAEKSIKNISIFWFHYPYLKNPPRYRIKRAQLHHLNKKSADQVDFTPIYGYMGVFLLFFLVYQVTHEGLEPSTN